jgi:lipooligosaccharide transport system ATP-binding protein
VELRYPTPEVQRAASDRLQAALGEVEVEPLADRVLVYTDDGDATAAHLTAHDITHGSLLVRRSTLEDVFLRLTGRSLAD